VIPETGAGLFLACQRRERIQDWTIFCLGVQEFDAPRSQPEWEGENVVDQTKWKCDYTPE
jgi:hypothetical protein